MTGENAYGMRKRLQALSNLMDRLKPRSVLEIGCGSGAYLLAPLAERYPAVSFLGIDTDSVSIDYARFHFRAENLQFESDADPGRCFDLVIASEVIEHVESPKEFLVAATARLNPGGKLFVTTPNGYGPFEWASLVQVLLLRSGIFPALRRAKRAIFGGGPSGSAVPDSYASSPHINFFSWREIRAVIGMAGLATDSYQGRTWLCGFGFDFLVRGGRLADWNARIADRLHPSLVSDWMFVLAPARPPQSGDYRRNGWARLRRRLNERMIETERR